MALSEAVFPNISDKHSVNDELDLEYPIVRKSQRQRKGAKVSAKFSNPLAEKALGVFKFGAPFDSQEAEGQIAVILKDQQDILKVYNLFYGSYRIIFWYRSYFKFYLESMQRHEIAAAILTAYVHREVPDAEPKLDIIKEQTNLAPSELTSTPIAFPMVQPMKAYVPCLHKIFEYRLLPAHFTLRVLKDLGNGAFWYPPELIVTYAMLARKIPSFSRSSSRK